VKLLLDTHAWLWLIEGDRRLSAAARSLLAVPQNPRFVSIASLWELAIKFSMGAYKLNATYLQFIETGTAGLNTSLLYAEPRHLDAMTTLPFHHRDPFDRLIIAQAKFEGMKLISNDRQFRPYGIDQVW